MLFSQYPGNGNSLDSINREKDNANVAPQQNGILLIGYGKRDYKILSKMDGAGLIIVREVKQAQKDKHHFILLAPHSNMCSIGNTHRDFVLLCDHGVRQAREER